MLAMSQDHLALYGNTAIKRAFCDLCQCFAFVIDGRIQCCGHEYEGEPDHFRRISEPEYKRQRPSETEQNAILNRQDHRCFYCEQLFYSTVVVKGRETVLKVEWDHLVPYVWQANNKTINFVAACRFCNRWKGSLLFATLEEAQAYVYHRWEKERAKQKAKDTEKVSVVRYGV